MAIQIYTDGSCIGNPGPGGWGIVVIDTDIQGDDGPGSMVVHTASGSEKDTTNNRMEMMALMKALDYMIEHSLNNTEVFSDSRLVVNTITLGWKKKANTDLWLEIEKRLCKVQIRLSWVKAHAENEFNNMVDQLAFKAANNA